MPRGQSAKKIPGNFISKSKQREPLVIVRPINQPLHKHTQQPETKQKQNKNTEMQIFDKQYTTRKCKEIQLKPTAIIFRKKQAADNE